MSSVPDTIKGLSEAAALLNRYEQEPNHVRHVATLAGQLFESLRDWHQLASRHGELLHLAALLHDIGWSQSPTGQGHHKFSAKLIEARDWKELSPAEVHIVAQTARYHRRSLPSDEHPGYDALPIADQKLVCTLAGILRVADALDRSHTQVVESVSARVSPSKIELHVSSRGPWSNELRAASKKCDLLEITSNRKVTLAR